MAILDPDPGKYEVGSASGAGKTNGGDSGKSTGEVISDVGRKAYEAGEGLAIEATQRAKSLFHDQRIRAADELHTLADVFHQTGEKLRNQDREVYAQYAEKIAEQTERASEYVREKEIGEIVDEVGGLVRRESVLFFGTVFAAGFLIARLLKNASQTSQGRRMSEEYGFEAAQKTAPLPLSKDTKEEAPYGIH